MKNPRIISKCVSTLVAGLSLCHSTNANTLVDLNATALPTGALASWPNTGTLGGNFTSEVDVPVVTTISGVKGVTFDGTNDWYVGPTAPAQITGNGNRSAIAWVYNPAIGTEETIVAWGRRGGGNGTDAAFIHGTHATWGALGQWGDLADVGWNGAQETGIWTCVAYSYNSATSTSSVYTNGQLSNSEVNGPLNTFAVSSSSTALPIVVGAQNLANGTRSSGNIPASLTIAKLKVYDTVLTPAEIAAAFSADAATFGRVVISQFTAGSSSIYRGDSTTLGWSVAGATSVSISPSITIPPGNTSVSVSPLTTTTYTLTATGTNGSTTKTATITVDPGVPQANAQTVAANMNTTKPVTLTATDPNTPPGSLTWSIVAGPAHGALTGTAPALTYTPTTGYSGLDSFTFKVNDGFSDSNTATVSITVNPPNTAPSAVSVSASTIPSTAVAGSFLANLTSTDPNFGETHSYQLVSGTGSTNNGFFSITGNQLIAQHNFSGDVGSVFSIRVRSTDSNSLSTEIVLTLTVVSAPAGVVINEIHYDPANNERFEFIELYNPTATTIALGGWQFTSGVTYTFPGGASIAAGGYVVLAMDSASFLAQFGFAPFGQFTGKLSGDGELIELRNAANAIIDQVEYQSQFPWPVSAGSGGSSMELIHPSLDNNLAGSWRASASQTTLPELTYVSAATTGWKWRPGNTEASSPTSAWRANSFVTDGTWSAAVQAPIGYGTIDNLPLNTTISGMVNTYRHLFARKTFTINAGEIPSALKLRYTQDDGIFIWINGNLVAQKNITGTVTEPTIATTASNQSTEGLWYEVNITNASTFLVAGTNTIAVQLINTALNSTDIGFDVELKRPSATQILQPTPAAQNTVYSFTAPPQIRQVDHSPKQPDSNQSTTISTKITDPQGVGQVQLLYQIVAPGSFIPSRFPRTVAQVMADPEGERPINTAFENAANWTTATMYDDGSHGDATAADGIFSAVIPAQAHRTLVRYRILAADIPGLQIRVPYADDESLNFAYFVYNGVPDFVASTASVDPAGAGKVWPKTMLASLPVYHWLIRHEDMMTLQAYNTSEQFTNNGTDTELAARRAEEWEGAFIYDGVVYDHVCTRLRGGNSRYGDFDGRFPKGKRHYKFQFKAGNYLQARDQSGKAYPTKWKALALNRMFGTKGGNGWGMPEEIGATLWKTFGIPAQNTHWIHFRVVDDTAEAPDQYNGDFWGLTQAVEEYDGNYLDARGMAKGNLYKMSDWIWDADRQRRYQSPDMVRDGSEFNNVRDNLHGGQSAAWLNQYVNYEKWYRYSAVAEGIRHYDLFPYTDDVRNSLKNLAWYFEPVGADPTRGVCTFLPYDWDASFGPSFNNGWEHANNALYGWDQSTATQNGMTYIDKPEMKLAHRNVLREFRDLIWQTDQLNNLMDDRAAVIAEFSKADQDRWRNAPVASGTGNDDALTTKVQDMKNFCFTGWSGASGPTVGAGGRGAYLDTLADTADAGLLPAKPTITYTGAPNHPLNGLAFQTTAFSDPQGAGTFAAMAWRIGEIENPAAPAYNAADDFKLEYNPIWESENLTTFQGSVSIPLGALKPGHTYRARVRMQDATGRWGHWSAPYQFTTIAPAGLADLQQNLMITEIMYNPAGPALPGGSVQDFEFIELQNISSTLTLDLTDVGFTKGVDFDFTAGTTIAPGARMVVVKNLAAFQSRYGTGIPVAGVWDSADNLSNGGEQLKISYGSAVGIQDFEYDDIAPWPLTPKGTGPSLQLINPYAVPPDLGNGVKWKASDSLQGSPGNPDSRFAVWMSQRNVSNPNSEAIPGMSQTLMYSLGADLLANPAAAMPVASFTAGTGTNKHLAFSYHVRLTGSDVTYIPETSTDFSGWQSGPSVIEQIGSPVANGDGTQTVLVRVITPSSADTKRFIRLRAVVNP